MVAYNTYSKLQQLNANDYLTPLFLTNLKKRKLVSLDVETYAVKNKKFEDGFEHKFYIGGLYDGVNFKVYNEDEKVFMQKELLSKKYAHKYIVATNLLFDFVALYYNSHYFKDFYIILNGGRMIACIYQTKKYTIVFVDTLNYAQFSVKVMGDILDMPKLESPSCLGRLPENKKEYDELVIYNKRDCEVSYHFMEFLQDGFNKVGGKLKLTISSTAMDIFRRKYLRFPIVKETATLKDESIKKHIFDGYFGGRTENISRGKILNAYSWDVNSLYPYAMTQEFPNPNSVRLGKTQRRNVLEFEGVSKVRISTSDLHYPYLPFREQKLLFPNGEFVGTYSHYELRRAIELGYRVKKMYKTIYYTKTFTPFKEYVFDLYEKRREYKAMGSPNEIVYKLLLNSLYGRFAMKEKTQTSFIDMNFESDDFKERFYNDESLNITMFEGGKGMMSESIPNNQPSVFPILSSHTTSIARDILYNYMTKYKALYVDTDSVTTLKEIPSSTKLGGMKCEYNIKYGCLVKPKFYHLHAKKDGKSKYEDVVKIKGVMLPNLEKFNTLIDGGKVIQEKFVKLKEGIRRDIPPNSVIKTSKRASLEDDKRNWCTQIFNRDEYQTSIPRIINV